MINPEVGSALIGAGVSTVAMLANRLVVTAKMQAKQEEHSEKFKEVGVLFAGLDQRFVPRNELDSRLTSLDRGQERIEKLLNLALSLGRDRNFNRDGREP